MNYIFKFLFFGSALLVFGFFNACNKSNLVSADNPKSNGKILIKLEQNNIPSDVTKITAELSRLNFDTLRTNIDVSIDSLNVLSFEAVPIGGWHLKVNAENSAAKIIYTGETEVTIIEDQNIDVFLSLTRVGSGTGNINIFISWESAENWSDYFNNPVFNPTDDFSPYGVTGPKLIVDGSLLKMWYRQQDASGHSTIGYAVSHDGINWDMPLDHPALDRGDYDAWDSYAVTSGVVIKEENSYKMFYSGTNVHDGYSAVGLAYSSDGINWEKTSEPVLVPNDYEVAVCPESIIKVDNKYYLYYCMGRFPNHRVGLAISTDGVNWERYSNNPVLSPTETWEGECTYYSSVIVEKETYKMVYWNYKENAWGFGKATSTDGMHWIKNNNNPCFITSQTSSNWTNRIVYPFLIKFNNKYRIYYSSGEYTYKIGFTESAVF